MLILSQSLTYLHSYDLTLSFHPLTTSLNLTPALALALLFEQHLHSQTHSLVLSHYPIRLTSLSHHSHTLTFFVLTYFFTEFSHILCTRTLYPIHLLSNSLSLSLPLLPLSLYPDTHHNTITHIPLKAHTRRIVSAFLATLDGVCSVVELSTMSAYFFFVWFTPSPSA